MKNNIHGIFPYSEQYFKDIEKVVLYERQLLQLHGSRILITGAGGLIGSAIVDLLIYLNEKKNANIKIALAVRNKAKLTNRFSRYLQKEYIEILYYDACKKIEFATKPLDFIIHAAGNAHPEVIMREPVQAMTANFIGIQRLLEYARKIEYKNLVYLSSSEIYGIRAQNVNSPISEGEYGYIDILNVRSSYPISKRASETLLKSYIHEYGINACIVRPGHVYGPTQTSDDSRASAQFLRAAVYKEDIIMKSDGMQMRSYCHCLDCASAILTVMLKGECGEAYNISNKESIITIRDFAEMCASLSGSNVLYQNSNEGERSGYNMMSYSALESRKLESLGWKGKYNLEEGIAESIRILRESYKANDEITC